MYTFRAFKTMITSVSYIHLRYMISRRNLDHNCLIFIAMCIYIIQPGQINVCFWYPVKSDLSIVSYWTSVHCTNHFLQSTRNTRPCTYNWSSCMYCSISFKRKSIFEKKGWLNPRPPLCFLITALNLFLGVHCPAPPPSKRGGGAGADTGFFQGGIDRNLIL